MLNNLVEKFIAESPNTSGIYKFIGNKGEILYVGKARNLSKRLQSYLNPNRLSTRIGLMTQLAQKVEIVETESELAALLLEHNLIKQLKPRFNILLKDGRSFPYICLTTAHQFPRVEKYRGAKQKNQKYFGPFIYPSAVDITIDIVKRVFLLRSCSDTEFKSRTKPCLEYQIKRCSAPCVGYITQAEYNESVKAAADSLSGKSVLVQQQLAKQMESYSAAFEYEKAALVRDKIQALSAIQARQNISVDLMGSADVVVITCLEKSCCVQVSFFRNGNNYGNKSYFYDFENDESSEDMLFSFLGQFYLRNEMPEQILLNFEIEKVELLQEFLTKMAGHKVEIVTPKRGEKLAIVKDQENDAARKLNIKIKLETTNEKLLSELKEIFKLPKVPAKIEVYDNSHISGKYAVGTFIAADVSGFVKSDYRKFNLALESNKDDTAMIKEVLRRRFTNDKKMPEVPDLIIIDGGLGQLNAALEIFDELKIKDVQLMSMAKGEIRNAGFERFFMPNRPDQTLPNHHPVMHYLQRLRDEAHRFAITTHRSKREKSVTKSDLDTIEGIGKARKKALLNHFGSVEKIKSATIKDLLRVKGISKSVADKIISICKKD